MARPQAASLTVLRASRRPPRAGRDGADALEFVRADEGLAGPHRPAADRAAGIAHRRPTRAAEIYAGRFVFAGKIVTCHGRSNSTPAAPSDDWETALLGFGWLRHLRAADLAITRANARSLVEEWLGNQTRTSSTAWRADVLGRRVMSFLSQAPLVLSEADDGFYRRFLRNLSREIRDPRSTASNTALAGMPRLTALIALCYASLCLANQARHIRSAAKRLSDELQRQVLPDGGHISRNPQALIDLLLDLLPLRQTFTARNIPPPAPLLNAIDRMMPMLRFFRHGDGNFALFNGMSTTPTGLVATLLAYDDTRGVPMVGMPHTGYQRLELSATAIIMDTGTPPPSQVSQDAHASWSCVRDVVGHTSHRRQLRPAADRPGKLARLRARDGGAFDADLSRYVAAVSSRCRLSSGCSAAHPCSKVRPPSNIIAKQRKMVLSASHDGYLKRFGIVHRRAILPAE